MLGATKRCVLRPRIASHKWLRVATRLKNQISTGAPRRLASGARQQRTT